MPDPDPTELTLSQRGIFIMRLISREEHTTAEIARLIGRSVRQTRRILADISQRENIYKDGRVWVTC